MPLNARLKNALESVLSAQFSRDLRVLSSFVLCGGSVCNAVCVETPVGNFFVKYLCGAARFFAAEVRALNLLAETQEVSVPKVWGDFSDGDLSFLILDYVPPKTAELKSGFERLGRDLARLHAVCAPEYGFCEDNFIGRLPQKNAWSSSWRDFFFSARLEPQIELARRKGLWSSDLERLYRKVSSALSDCLDTPKASLLHGDLWSGNLLIGENGTPYLVDPAIYYGSREIDLAMTRLFGGFPQIFYDAYTYHYPLEKGYLRRMRVYQCYPLLVHLNLFGVSYIPRIRGLLESFL